MKKKFYFIFLALIFVFAGCASNKDRFYITYVDDGQLVFIKPTSEKINNKQIQEISIDATLVTAKTQIVKDPVINYTLYFKSGALSPDGAAVYLVCNSKKYLLNGNEIIYKELTDKGNLKVRYSSKLSAEDFSAILDENSDIYINIEYENQETEILSKEFNQKINEARVIIF